MRMKVTSHDPYVKKNILFRFSVFLFHDNFLCLGNV